MMPATYMAEQREPVWLSIKEYAETRKVSERTVWRLIKAGKLTIERVSVRTVRICLTRVTTKPH
jgi:excisionase family DNA binding protein